METSSGSSTLPDGVFSDGERLWRARPSATSTFEESLAARDLFMDLHRDQFWNPWRMEDQTTELGRAQEVMQEWDRAEPGFRRMTKRQLDARMVRRDRDLERRRERAEKERQANQQRYDADREQARLALLEQQCILRHKQAEVAGLRSGESFPAMDQKRRAEKVAELDGSIERHVSEIERLSPVVGDPEDVPDAQGRLPWDRRHWTLHLYRERRIDEVGELRTSLSDLEVQLKATTDRSERSKLRTDRDIQKWRLDRLLAVPRQEPANMCADCALPAFQHGYVSPPFVGPCPAWPGQRAIRARMLEMLKTFGRRRDAQPAPAAVPKPQPLAVVPSGLPIGEVVLRLQELQEQYPDAEVRRGRASRWELWPLAGDSPEDRAGPLAFIRATAAMGYCQLQSSRIHGG